MHCIVLFFEKKIGRKNGIVLYCFCQIVLYCIPKNQISRFPTYRVKVKRLYCIVFKKGFFCHEFCTIVLYCISRFPTYIVKAKRLYCIVFKKKIDGN